MKARGWGERGKWMKVKKQKKWKYSPSTFTCCKDSRPCPTVSQYQLDASAMQDTRHLPHPTTPAAFSILQDWSSLFAQTFLSKQVYRVNMDLQLRLFFFFFSTKKAWTFFLFFATKTYILGTHYDQLPDDSICCFFNHKVSDFIIFHPAVFRHIRLFCGKEYFSEYPLIWAMQFHHLFRLEIVYLFECVRKTEALIIMCKQ